MLQFLKFEYPLPFVNSIFNHLHAGYFFMLLLGVDFKKNRKYYQSTCQTVLIQIRPTILPGMVWIQTVYKSADGKGCH